MTPEQAAQLPVFALSVVVTVMFGLVLVADLLAYRDAHRVRERREGAGASLLRAVIKSLVLTLSLVSITVTSGLTTFTSNDDTRRVAGLLTRALVTGALLVGGLALDASILLDRRRHRHAPDD